MCALIDIDDVVVVYFKGAYNAGGGADSNAGEDGGDPDDLDSADGADGEKAEEKAVVVKPGKQLLEIDIPTIKVDDVSNSTVTVLYLDLEIALVDTHLSLLYDFLFLFLSFSFSVNQNRFCIYIF